ncbi:MAG: hypothetical protein WBS20_12055 [Lysobacterales bacterium]
MDRENVVSRAFSLAGNIDEDRQHGDDSRHRGRAFIAQGDIESAREEFDRSNSSSGFYWLGVFN